ncbi:hypothetical protein HY416_00395 [Candidatus Kaiserbacteria bacterium]|nr:hypothetical protein [Candidatus Kaiserbacteria bacterium]
MKTPYRYQLSARLAVAFVTLLMISVPLSVSAAPTGSIDTDSLATTSSKPIITGTASGTKTVRITVREEGESKTLYKSKTIKVKKDGTWKAKILKKLPDGTYDVSVSRSGSATSVVLASGTLIVGKEIRDNKRNTSKKADTTMVVEPVLLLTGGTVSAGASVPVSYLQITNTGLMEAKLNGFSVKQNGSADPESVIGLTTVDDAGVSRGSVGGVEHSTIFKNGVAFVPAVATFAPGQMRLFTIKAVMSGDLSSYLGGQLAISVTSVDASAKVKGIFPIPGTTWIIQ